MRSVLAAAAALVLGAALAAADQQAQPMPLAGASPAAMRGDVLYRVTLLRAAPGRLLDLVDGGEAAKRRGSTATPRAITGTSWSFAPPATTRSPGRRGRAALAPEELVAWQEEELSVAPTSRGIPAYRGGARAHRDVSRPRRQAGRAREGARDGERVSGGDRRTAKRHLRPRAGRLVGCVHPRRLPRLAPLRRSRRTCLPTRTEEAAKAAGFSGRAGIGPYLRSLILDHHDTLAVPVR